MQLYTGCVENRQDPLKLGRCQVRIVGLHTDDKTILSTDDLPWAYPMQPVTSAAISGIGQSPVGPVPGTWVIIMFRDDDLQQPVMMGTIGGIPQTKSGERAAEDSSGSILPKDGGTLTDSSGNAVRDGSGNPITTGTTSATNNRTSNTNTGVVPTPVAVSAANDPNIPTTPPKKSVSDVATATANIKHLIDACDQVGLTTKYAKCALLGIAGGESGWIPQLELYNYSPDRLAEIFTVTKEETDKYAYAAKKGVSRQEFFSWIYGPTKRGKGFLGNKTDEDGGKYFGRGFIQLTGRGNYERYQKLATAAGLNVNIVDDPDSLNKDPKTSAIIAALYIKDRVDNYKTKMYDSGFFEAAKTAVGKNSPDIAVKKRTYYEHFLGGSSSALSTNKNATSTAPEVSAADIAAAPPALREALTEDRTVNSTNIGFTDPSGKYPLRDHMNESDTNRLARGIIDGTCFAFKDSMRKTNVPTANGKKWSQPLAPYNTIYPYNKVMETESGHLLEFDDSPDGERIHLYHRTGTSLEIDPNGSQVNYIVGDSYTIVIRNNNIYIVGSSNLTVGGNMRVLVKGDANIEVEGNTSLLMKGDGNIGVAGNLDVAVGGDYHVKVAGDYRVDAMNINTRTSGKQAHYSQGTYDLFSEGDINATTSANFNADYNQMQFGNGNSNAAVTPAVDLTPPELIRAIAPEFDNLQPPERSFDDVAKFETPDEWETPAGKAEKEVQFNNPTYKSEINTNGTAQEAVIPSGNNVKGKAVDTRAIYAGSDFSPSYKLSKNFTIAQLIEPSVILEDITLPPSIGQGGGTKLYTKQDLVANLAALATNICEPIYDLLGPTGGKFAAQSSKGLWYINSGLRNAGTVASSKNTSDHLKGRAIDIRYNPKRSFEETWKLAVELEKILPYNQLILEYRKPGSAGNPGPGWMNWIHISYSTEGNAKQAFTMIDDKSVNSTGAFQAGSRGLFLFGA